MSEGSGSSIVSGSRELSVKSAVDTLENSVTCLVDLSKTLDGRLSTIMRQPDQGELASESKPPVIGSCDLADTIRGCAVNVTSANQILSNMLQNLEI